MAHTEGYRLTVDELNGVELRLGLVDEDDAAYEVEAARELEFDDEDSSDEESHAK